MKEIIKLCKIKKTYGKRIIFNDLDLTVNQGEFISIGGASGEGKTTLLNILGMLDRFQSGRYYFDNIDVAEKKSERIRVRSEKIGFVFQDYCLLESLSVADNILMPFFYSESRIANSVYDGVRDYLERFGLKNMEKTKAKYLSGGEKQRVSIIRAMIKKPALVLADEPTGNLDPNNAEIISTELRKMADAGTTVVVVTHNQEVFKHVDRRYRLADGRLFYE